MIKHLLTLIISVFFINTYSQSFTQNFDDITTLTGSGWFMQNNSSPLGITNWFQGTPVAAAGPFDAYNGAANAYIGANFNNTTGGTGTISNWLVAPNRTLRNGDVFTFYTRKYDVGQDFPDRLEVRMSTNGASTNVGAGATATGDFTTLLLSINPTLVVGGYPRQWTQYTITISGLPAPTSGRIAFRYFVTNAGPTGTNSDYIGIDNVVYTPYVCPAFTMTPGGALTGGTAGTAYTTTLTQTGALGTPNFAVTAGALPPGLTMASNGTISGTPTATGTFNFTATVNDASGCSGSQAYSITVVCPANPITFSTPPSLCENDETYTLIEGIPAGGTYSGTGVSDGVFDPAAGTQTITYDFTDAYGCAHSSNFTITVNDSPTVTLAGGVLENGFIGSAYSATFGQIGGTGTPVFTVSSGALPNGINLSTAGVLSGTPTEYGTFNFTVSVSDGNSCSGGEDYTLIIEDCPLPATSIADFNAQCSVALSDLTIPVMNDNCGNPITPTTNATFPISTQGTTIITWSYTEISGNVVTKNQNIIIDDTIAPVPTVGSLPNINAQCEVNQTDVTIPMATDNCGGTVTVTNDAVFPITSQGTTVITWTYEDENGNTSTQTQNVIINDITAPVPTVGTLPNITAQCEVNQSDVTIPTATDNCGGTVTVSNNVAFPITSQGTTVITWAYQDENGNTSTQTQNIIIDDTIAPVPTLGSLPNITAQCEVTQSDVTVPTATDNCGGTVTVTNDITFPITTQGTTVITWTYEDENGNISTQTQNVIIDDTTAPVPTLGTLPNITAQCQVNQSDVTIPTATDNCSGTVTVTNDITFPITTQGTTVITWTYEDENGNTSTQTQNVIIDDITAPVPTVGSLPNITAQCEVTQSDVTVPTATDNCGGTVTVTNNATFPITIQGTTVITWTYEDENGNTSTQTQNVIIDDTQNPTIAVENISLDLEGEGTISISADMFEDWADDNCGVDGITLSQTTFDCDDLGENTVTITVTDVNGNSTQVNFTVTINDPDNLCEELSVIDNVRTEFTLYPNPARGKVYVKSSSHVTIQKITVYSLTGERIKIENYNSVMDQYEVNLNHLDAGTYILHIETSTGIFTKKLLVKG